MMTHDFETAQQKPYEAKWGTIFGTLAATAAVIVTFVAFSRASDGTPVDQVPTSAVPSDDYLHNYGG